MYVSLAWTIFQLGGTVFVASRAARLSTGRAVHESLVASLLGFTLLASKILLH